MQANANTIWLKWDRLDMNSSEQRVEPSSVTYFLYMRGCFQRLLLEDRVLVWPPAPAHTSVRGLVRRPSPPPLPWHALRFSVA